MSRAGFNTETHRLNGDPNKYYFPYVGSTIGGQPLYDEYGNPTNMRTYDVSTHMLLQDLLLEMRLMRMHLETITEETITEEDISDDYK
jgi:hypothetical protein